MTEPIDPDVDLRIPEERAESREPARLLGAIALGGLIGASARYGLEQAWPTVTGGFPWATFVVNLTGCLALGALMAWIGGREGVHPLLRPFFGTGLLGGYTTFSTYAVEGNDLILGGHPALGLGYLAGSVLGGLVAAYAGLSLVERLRGAAA